MPESDYEWLDRMNLCHRCRKERPAPGRKFCFDCLDKIREENARRYDPGKAREYQARRRELYRQKKTAGICVRCSKPATHGIYCYDHLIAAKRHNRETARRRCGIVPRQLCEPRARLLCIVPRQRVRVQNLQGRVKLGLSMEYWSLKVRSDGFARSSI